MLRLLESPILTMSRNRNTSGWCTLGSCIGFLWPVRVNNTSLVNLPVIVIRTFQLPLEPPLAIRWLSVNVPDRDTAFTIPWAQVSP